MNLREWKKEIISAVKNGRIYFNTRGVNCYNPKTYWFIHGCKKGNTKGVGIQKATNILWEIINDETQDTHCKLSQGEKKGYSNYRGDYHFSQRIAIIYTRHSDKMYLKFFPEKESEKGWQFYVVIHGQKENELYELFGDSWE